MVIIRVVTGRNWLPVQAVSGLIFNVPFSYSGRLSSRLNGPEHGEWDLQTINRNAWLTIFITKDLTRLLHSPLPWIVPGFGISRARTSVDLSDLK
jgi:hypothetical protein